MVDRLARRRSDAVTAKGDILARIMARLTSATVSDKPAANGHPAVPRSPREVFDSVGAAAAAAAVALMASPRPLTPRASSRAPIAVARTAGDDAAGAVAQLAQRPSIEPLRPSKQPHPGAQVGDSTSGQPKQHSSEKQQQQQTVQWVIEDEADALYHPPMAATLSSWAVGGPQSAPQIADSSSSGGGGGGGAEPLPEAAYPVPQAAGHGLDPSHAATAQPASLEELDRLHGVVRIGRPVAPEAPGDDAGIRKAGTSRASSAARAATGKAAASHVDSYIRGLRASQLGAPGIFKLTPTAAAQDTKGRARTPPGAAQAQWRRDAAGRQGSQPGRTLSPGPFRTGAPQSRPQQQPRYGSQPARTPSPSPFRAGAPQPRQQQQQQQQRHVVQPRERPTRGRSPRIHRPDGHDARVDYGYVYPACALRPGIGVSPLQQRGGPSPGRPSNQSPQPFAQPSRPQRANGTNRTPPRAAASRNASPLPASQLKPALQAAAAVFTYPVKRSTLSPSPIMRRPTPTNRQRTPTPPRPQNAAKAAAPAPKLGDVIAVVAASHANSAATTPRLLPSSSPVVSPQGYRPPGGAAVPGLRLPGNRASQLSLTAKAAGAQHRKPFVPNGPNAGARLPSPTAAFAGGKQKAADQPRKGRTVKRKAEIAAAVSAAVAIAANNAPAGMQNHPAATTSAAAAQAFNTAPQPAGLASQQQSQPPSATAATSSPPSEADLDALIDNLTLSLQGVSTALDLPLSPAHSDSGNAEPPFTFSSPRPFSSKAPHPRPAGASPLGPRSRAPSGHSTPPSASPGPNHLSCIPAPVTRPSVPLVISKANREAPPPSSRKLPPADADHRSPRTGVNHSPASPASPTQPKPAEQPAGQAPAGPSSPAAAPEEGVSPQGVSTSPAADAPPGAQMSMSEEEKALLDPSQHALQQVGDQ